MIKRRLLRCSLILITLAAFAVWLEPTRVVWGWLCGEAFYQGRPTSWWASEIECWHVTLQEGGGLVQTDGTVPMTESFERTLGTFEQWLSRWIPTAEKPWPKLLDGDSEGKAV